MQKQKPKTNGTGSEQQSKKILDELGLQEQILSGSESNPLLRDTNLGLGKYDDDYKWQQVRSYRKGLFAWIAFGRVLTKRKLYETKYKLGRDGFNSIYDSSSMDVRTFEPLDDSDVSEDESTWSAALELGRKRWQRLGEPDQVLSDQQLSAIMSKTGISDEWKPLFWELVSGRHEVSRSDEAELLRDALTGIKHLRDDSEEERGLLS